MNKQENKTYPAGLICDEEDIHGARIYRAVLLDPFGKNRGEVTARMLFWESFLNRDRELYAIRENLLQHLICGFIERNASPDLATVLKDGWQDVLDLLQKHDWTYMIRHSDGEPNE